MDGTIPVTVIVKALYTQRPGPTWIGRSYASIQYRLAAGKLSSYQTLYFVW